MKSAILSLFMLGILCSAVSQQPQPQSEPQAKAENFETVIELNRRFKNRIFDKDFWKIIEVTDKENDKTKSFTELTSLQQHVFVITLATQLLEQSERLQGIWIQEINKFNDPEYKSTLTRKQVQKYYDELFEVRSEFIASYCQFIDNVIKTFKDEITEPEKKALQSNVLKLKKGLISKKE